MNGTILPDGRMYLPEGTILKMEHQGCYKILGAPVGYGGAGIIYPAARAVWRNNTWKTDEMWVALKECYPSSTGGGLVRDENGRIFCAGIHDSYTAEYYAYAKEMMRREKEISGQVFNRGFRLTPIWAIAEKEEISLDGARFYPAENQYGIMERLDEKGTSLGQILRNQKGGYLTAYETVCVLRQVLQAVSEVHRAGFLHGDIQENNIFLKGTYSPQRESVSSFAKTEFTDSEGRLNNREMMPSPVETTLFAESENRADFAAAPDKKQYSRTDGLATLLDFGSARAFLEDGATAEITDKKLYSTSGYAAPECRLENDGTLRLTRAADLYSVGYLMLRMLTGKAMDTRALELVVNGKYLYPRQAKKIGCPSGSMDAVNRVLEKALQKNPSDRYQGAEEMLEDIGRLEQALAPQKSAIAAVDYEAFISYCHEEKSTRAAELIQKKIERYRIPKSVQRLSGKTKMGKVFRDREELASSSDMEVHLKEALDHSEFLILLLSPKVPESPWVNREIELFLQNHDREHVLTVLTDGELQESFPEILRKNETFDGSQMRLKPVESLAADIRGEDEKEQKRKLKTEIYRLLAPMLGCSFDDLRQRQKEYQFRRTLCFTTAAMIVFGIAAGYMSWQAYQIHENYWETLKKQSRYLAEVSADLLKNGDRKKSIQVAMEALPQGTSDTGKPLMEEAEAALANAVYAYQGVESTARFVSTDFLMEMDTKSAGQEALSPDGSWLLSMDQKKTVYIWDGQSDEAYRKWDANFWNQQRIDTNILCCAFLDSDTVLLVTQSSMVKINIETEEILMNQNLVQELTREKMAYGWYKEIVGDNTGIYSAEYEKLLARYEADARCCALSEDGSQVAVYDFYSGNGLLSVYQTLDGKRIYSGEIGPYVDEKLAGNQLLEQIKFSPDGSRIAISISHSWYTDVVGDAQGMLLVVDLQDGSVYRATDPDMGFYDLCFLENDKVAVFGHPQEVYENPYEVSAEGRLRCYQVPEKAEDQTHADNLENAGDMETMTEIPGITELRETTSGSEEESRPEELSYIWESYLDCQFGPTVKSGLSLHAESGQLLLWCGRQIKVYDAADGELLKSSTHEENIAGVELRRDTEYFVAMQDGSLCQFSLSEDSLWELGTNVKKETDGFLYNAKAKALYQFSEEGEIVCLKRLEDEQRQVVEVEGPVTGITLHGERPYYSVSRNTEDGSGTIQTFYDREDHTKQFALTAEGDIWNQIWLGDGKTYCYLTNNAEGIVQITAYDTQQEQILWQEELEEYDVSNVSFYETEKGEYLALCRCYAYAEILNLESREWEERIVLELSQETAEDSAVVSTEEESKKETVIPDMDEETDAKTSQDEEIGNIFAADLSADGIYVLLLERYEVYSEEGLADLRIYNREKNCWVNLPESLQNLDLRSSFSSIITMANHKNLAAIYEAGSSQAAILDLDKMELLQRIPFGASSQRKMRFMADDSGLLLWGDDGYLKLWDIQKACITMEDSQRLYDVREIFVEDDSDFIWVRGADEEKADMVIGDLWIVWMYRLAEEGRFYPYTRIWMGTYMPQTDRFVSISSDKENLYWYDRYSLDELLEMGREVVGDLELDEIDRVKYYISE